MHHFLTTGKTKLRLLQARLQVLQRVQSGIRIWPRSLVASSRCTRTNSKLIIMGWVTFVIDKDSLCSTSTYAAFLTACPIAYCHLRRVEVACLLEAIGD